MLPITSYPFLTENSFRLRSCTNVLPSSVTLALILVFSHLLYSQTPEKDVWINEPLMPSGDVTLSPKTEYCDIG